MGLSSTLPAWASGGNTPVPGIDIIIKNVNFEGSFSRRDLEAVNNLKGMDKPELIAKIAAGYLTKAMEGDAPEGGWAKVLTKGLMSDWNVDERGGTTAIKVRTKGSEKPMTVIFKLAP